MFNADDHVIHVRRNRSVRIVRQVPLTSGRAGFECEWIDAGKPRRSFFREDELKPVKLGRQTSPSSPSSARPDRQAT